MSNKEVNSLILMLGMMNSKLDDIIKVLYRLERKEAVKRVSVVEHIRKGDTQK
jgi:hypothetical protein